MVFIKGVQYTNRLVGYYLSINDKSDWTHEEREMLHQRVDGHPMVNENEPVRVESIDGEFSAMSREEVASILSEIVMHKHDDPAFSMVANELSNSRQKCSVSERGRCLSIDQLMKDPEKIRPPHVSPKMVSSVPSNNPDYKNPDLEISGEVGEESENLPDVSEANSPVTNILRIFDDFWSTDRKEFKLRSKEPSETRVYLDYRDTNCIAPVKDQRKCGSCYAFSSMAVYEYLHCNQTGELVTFAEQFVVDCGKRFGMYQCKGGSMNKLGKFVNEVGLELASYYPYRARGGACPYGESDAVSQMGYKKVKNGRMVVLYLGLLFEDQVVRLLKTKGPLTFAIEINDEFDSYGGGVHQLSHPKRNSAHSMTLVGHGIEEGEEYWLLRNSYGISWGEQGYYKLSKDNLDTKSLLWLSYMEADFVDNESHQVEKVARGVRKNMNLFERAFNL